MSHDPQFPIYIISKGRWKSRHTSKALEKMKVSYKIVVEEQERDAYAAAFESMHELVNDALAHVGNPKAKYDLPASWLEVARDEPAVVVGEGGRV